MPTNSIEMNSINVKQIRFDHVRLCFGPLVFHRKSNKSRKLNSTLIKMVISIYSVVREWNGSLKDLLNVGNKLIQPYGMYSAQGKREATRTNNKHSQFDSIMH